MLESPLSPDLVTLVRELMRDDKHSPRSQHMHKCLDSVIEFKYTEWCCPCGYVTDELDFYEVIFECNCPHVEWEQVIFQLHPDDILPDCLSELEDEFYVDRASYCAFGED